MGVSYYREYIDYTKEEFDLLIDMFFDCRFFMGRALQDVCHKHKYNTRKVYNALKSASYAMKIYQIPAAMYELRYDEIPLLVNDYSYNIPLIRTVLNWRLKIGK